MSRYNGLLGYLLHKKLVLNEKLTFKTEITEEEKEN